MLYVAMTRVEERLYI
ncbi:hypothetical protein [Gemella haemolysans]